MVFLFRVDIPDVGFVCASGNDVVHRDHRCHHRVILVVVAVHAVVTYGPVFAETVEGIVNRSDRVLVVLVVDRICFCNLHYRAIYYSSWWFRKCSTPSIEKPPEDTTPADQLWVSFGHSVVG